MKQINSVLSIDIGLKNLALCLLSNSDSKLDENNPYQGYQIELWSLFDILE